MSPLHDLTRLPEWSEFFRAALIENQLHFEWRADGDEWTCQAWEVDRDLSQPMTKVILSDARHPDTFEALRLAMEQSGRDIRPEVRSAFLAFRAAATGATTSIEDLL